ncbi:hypothetical protein C7M84_010980 [Penaeus vannamei]|uniref:Uncharacterized protein n=1 Tax=Penaeus vannamei TaxID=6689 RepID=A0A423T2Q3_PENVA|nr:hypothetical protein C7M84_010980 [Penaeus vannamei]
MRHLVTASLLLLAAVGGRVGVRGRPQDMSAEDTHKRYVLAEPPRREAEQRNFSFWGRGASGGGSAERRPNLPWQTSPRTPSHKRPPPQRHNLRVHSFQSTFPFESEVRGEGYHSTIRFDPFGSSLPPQSSHYPKSQTYGNWGTTRRPRPVASAEIPGPLPSPVSAAFASAEVYSSGEKLGRLPLAPTEFPRPFPDPSIRASVPDSGFPRPPPARPFLNPGNLAGLLEGDSLGDAITPVSAPADLTTDATPLSPSASREVASGRPSPEDVDIDYPSVANVFADRPSQPRSGEQVAASEANSEPRLEASDRNEADHNSSAGIVPEASVEVAVSTARPPPAVAEDQGQDPAPSQESFAGDSAPPAGSKGEAAHDYDPEYYDNLYDEFMDMYYDQTGADGGEGPSSPPSPPDDHEEQPSRSIPATTASSTVARSGAPISLSEILQGMGMILPQFLVALQGEGMSLKEFTTSLQARGLTQREFSGVKGSIFGFMPGGRLSFEGAKKPGGSSTEEGAGKGAGEGVQASAEGDAATSAAAGEGADEGQSPIPIKVDLASIMKDKGLSASDILHDLGSIFSLTDSGPSEGGAAAAKKASPAEGGGPSSEEQGGDGPRPRPYTTPETPVSLRPYRTSAESGRRPPRPYRPLGHEGGRSDANYRRILTNRFQTTERTTLRPPYVPPPYNPESDLSSLLDDDYFPLYDDDPNSLNMSTKSAIMAASILGGVAMCVFLAILVVVMYKGRARNRRVPLALPSDASSSSTPPIYSTRMSVGKGAYKSAGFWGTLKKRFDPYSLSSTPTTMS